MAEGPTKSQRLQTTCAIAGGGPAGMMLGYLLARAGIDVVVLEKHADFLRDFRGDTIHPSTLELMHELGILREFLQRPHQEVRQFKIEIGGRETTIGDFSLLKTPCPFIAFMPQWEFLDFIAAQARRYPAFRLLMQAEATSLIQESGRVVGLDVITPDGPLQVRSRLTVGADGRASTVREQAGLMVDDVGAPIDVLWMRVSRRPGDPGQLVGRFDQGRGLIMIDRGDYWQCGLIIRKGGFDEIRRAGLSAFHENIAQIAPFLHGRLDELSDWNQIRLLTVRVDRLRRWYREGLLCIGDAAHAMSPVGGVGINLAIQDAVAAANLLYEPLRRGRVELADLQRVQRRREWPARVVQRVQVFVHRNFVNRVIASHKRASIPWFIRLIAAIPPLRRLPARLVGLGIRQEHIRTPEVASKPAAH